VSNVTALTSQSTIENLDGVAKPMLKLTHLGWKQRRVNPALTRSNAPTAKRITKPTPTFAHFGDTASTGNGT